MSVSADIIACELLDVVPVIMRTIRAEMRSHRSNELTVPLFRALMFLERHPGVSLQDLAGHLGLTSPTVCKIVDGLVSNRLVSRQPSSNDRRKITLTLTSDGREILEKARNSTQARLVELLASLSAEQYETVYQALKLLHPLFMLSEDQIVRGEIKI
jgi:DNA-binding MarR family transcriptional regulator